MYQARLLPASLHVVALPDNTQCANAILASQETSAAEWGEGIVPVQHLLSLLCKYSWRWCLYSALGVAVHDIGHM